MATVGGFKKQGEDMVFLRQLQHLRILRGGNFVSPIDLLPCYGCANGLKKKTVERLHRLTSNEQSIHISIPEPRPSQDR
jgi:hypothetical protein